MQLKSDFLRTLQERGFIHQCTDLEGLDALMAREKITAYIGFDCTAKSFHVGNLMQIMLLHWLQKTGHKPIVLMGGGTTKVGDPSGKDESRKLLTDEQITANMAGLKNIFSQFLTFSSASSSCGLTAGSKKADPKMDPAVKPQDDEFSNAIMVNNDDWLKTLNYIEFLRDYGRHFSINRMLTMDSVKLRLEREQELTFLEFNYMILQAYDFVKLQSDYGCRLQIGGADQWGNIVNGTELYRRLMAQKNQGKQNNFEEIFGLTSPLITTSSGAKMGKTAQGAVWLNAEMLSPYDYWQFWRNTEDADVGRFLRFFTDLPISEIEKLEKLEGAEINQAKIVLANEATKLCHGEKAAMEAAETARKAFTEGAVGGSIPEITIAADEYAQGIPVVDLFRRSGLVESGGEAKKLIRDGGARINDQKVSDERMIISAATFPAEGGIVKLARGKKQFAVVRVV